jgi:orotate phosphoribosyltransferase
MERAELARRIWALSHLTGRFLLRSGQYSNEYFDKYRFAAEPDVLRAVARAMAELLPPDTEVLAGIELGGVVLAAAMSLEAGLPGAYVRKQRKEYGTENIIEGASVRSRKVTIIEDIITTGGQVVHSSQDLRGEGALVDTVVCVIDRSHGNATALGAARLTLRAAFAIDELRALSNAG